MTSKTFKNRYCEEEYIFYRREIDGLRALAVVSVILFHAGFETFSGGFVGVDVFFVISGYLITSVILRQQAEDTFSLLDFYERRARRILPALFLVMAVCIPFAWLWMIPSEMKRFSQSLVAVPVFASNILFWKETGYFDAAAELKPLLHTWSLAVEEQYYLLYPLFLLLMWRFAKRWTVATLAVIVALSFALAQWGAYNKPAATFFLLPTRGWEIGIGALIAFYFARYPKLQLQRPSQEIGSLIGLSLIIYAVFAFSKETPFPSAYALVPTLGTALIILCTTPSTLLGRVLTTKAFVGVGLISYSAYLWHQPLFALTRVNYGSTSVVGSVLLINLTFFAAYVTYRFVELPIRRQYIRFKVSSLVLLATISIFFILFGLFGYFTNGVKGRFINDEHKIYETLERSSYTDCSMSISKCISEASKTSSVLLFGDSNAYHFSSSLKDIAIDSGLNYIQLTKGDCLPFSNFYRLDRPKKINEDCMNFNSKIRQAIFENKEKIEVIVVSAAWLLYLEGDEYFKAQQLAKRVIGKLSMARLSKDGVVALSRHEKVESFDHYIFEMLSLLISRSKKLILVGPIPPLISDFSGRRSFSNLQGVEASDFRIASLDFENIIKKHSVLNFSYIDIREEMCNQDICLARNLDGIYYGDPTHLSEYGQRIIVKPLFERAISKE